MLKLYSTRSLGPIALGLAGGARPPHLCATCKGTGTVEREAPHVGPAHVRVDVVFTVKSGCLSCAGLGR